MQNRKMQLKAPIADLTAQRAHFYVQETEIAGSRLLGRIRDVQLIVGKIESVAETVMTKAKNVYKIYL